MAYVRLAPSDPARWHVDPYRAAFPGKVMIDDRSSFVRDAPSGAFAVDYSPGVTAKTALRRLDAIALATPRTIALAGRPDEGMITWVTRSAVFGFPDYTTAKAIDVAGGASVSIYARQRFGVKDLGVNAARLQDWLGQLRR